MTHSYLKVGRSDEEIIILAEEIGAGLIVTGSRGLGGVRRALMGSISDSVVRHAHCPVLVVRKEQREEMGSIFPTRILLATDGSQEAELALWMAVDLANSTNSQLHVITVYQEYLAYVSAAAQGYPSHKAPAEAALEQLRQEAQETLDVPAKKIREAGGTATKTHLRVGGRRPDRQIVALAEQIGAGLIVVGSRGLGGMRRSLMGSVSASVVRYAHCPVLVVRKGEKFDQDVWLT